MTNVEKLRLEINNKLKQGDNVLWRNLIDHKEIIEFTLHRTEDEDIVRNYLGVVYESNEAATIHLTTETDFTNWCSLNDIVDKLLVNHIQEANWGEGSLKYELVGIPQNTTLETEIKEKLIKGSIVGYLNINEALRDDSDFFIFKYQGSGLFEVIEQGCGRQFDTKGETYKSIVGKWYSVFELVGILSITGLKSVVWGNRTQVKWDFIF